MFARPDAGRTAAAEVLTGSPRTYYVARYRESEEKLYPYAPAPDMFHRKAWARINRKEKKSRQHVGLWHETYAVPEGSTNRSTPICPPTGRAAATGVLPLEKRGRRAADRFAHRASRERAPGGSGELTPEDLPGS
ncbi:DUF4188 domain-containing protein [Streptomyces sp. NBC_01166]|nr:DUF4188 domain-containing protein [Streptomyces sp. NBC_01166]